VGSILNLKHGVIEMLKGGSRRPKSQSYKKHSLLLQRLFLQYGETSQTSLVMKKKC
jgi:hypothetical protein